MGVKLSCLSPLPYSQREAPYLSPQRVCPSPSETPTNPTLARSIHRRLLHLSRPDVAAVLHLVCSERTPCVPGCQYLGPRISAIAGLSHQRFAVILWGATVVG